MEGADGTAGLIAGYATEAGGQLIKDGEITSSQDILTAGLIGAGIGVVGSAIGQVAEAGVATATSKVVSESKAAAFAGGAASGTVDITAGVCGHTDIDC